jgi:hypothetical protein
MAIETSQFRIIPDPNDPEKWAYEPLAHHVRLPLQGGFRSAAAARRAFEKVRRSSPPLTSEGEL